MACPEFKRIVREAWPVAYAEAGGDKVALSDLGGHLKKVACLNKCLFSNRVSAVLARLELMGCHNYTIIASRSKAGDLLYVTGLLHDLGKASSFYLSRTSDVDCKISFYNHEHVGAIVVLLAIIQENPEVQNRATLAASIIARHHSAMEGRHPWMLGKKTGKDRDMKDIAMAVTELLRDEDTRLKLSGILKGGLSAVASEEWRRLLDAIVKLLDSGSSIEVDAGVVEELVSRYRLDGRAEDDMDCWRGFMTLLKSASGALIVSDILEASASRGGYGGFGRAYVNYWLRELYHRAECFRECGIDVSLPA